MTDAQRSYLDTLCRETGEEFDDALTRPRLRGASMNWRTLDEIVGCSDAVFHQDCSMEQS